MYQKSPMENFNKNNPFIMVSKQKYDKIIDDIHLFSINCIRGTIINCILWVINIILACVYKYTMKEYIFFSIIFILLAISIELIIIRFKQKIKYFISIHPNMQEFDRISSLEVNNILALNNEDVLKCLHGLYELHGELTSTIQYYRLLFRIYIVIEIIVTIILSLKFIL